MSSEKQHSPQHEELLKKQALEQQEVKEVLVFLQKYTKPVAIAIGVVCAIVLVIKFNETQTQKKEAEASTALMNANTAGELQAIVDDYASTTARPVALMGLALKKFNAGQVDEAATLYNQFLKEHGAHELATQAELSLITCKESVSLEEAQALYAKFAEEHADSYLAPAAMLSRASCLEALGKLDDARVAYEDILANFPDSNSARTADANLKVVVGKQQ